MNNKIRKIIVSVFCIFLLYSISGCEIFGPDGGKDTLLVNSGGYFYLAERESNSLMMMDTQLKVLKKWSLSPVTNDSTIQGLTFDGKFLWVSVAGNTDMIYQIDLTSDTITIIKGIAAPPSKRGTIRDITFDGTVLWAINSGSTTYSTPATLYKIDPTTGATISEYILPSTEPRGLTYVNPSLDVFGKGAEKGIYYTDIRSDKIYKYLPEKAFFDTAFSSPTPPRGISYIYPVGLTFDGNSFWLINSSDNADHLYQITFDGREIGRFDLPYEYPGAIVYSANDIRKGNPPMVLSVSPKTGLVGSNITVDIYGTNFKQGSGLKVDFGLGIKVNSLNFIVSTQIKADISIELNATLGKRNVTLTNPDGIIAKGDSLFEITQSIVTPYLWLTEQDGDSLYKIRINDTTVVKKWDTKIVGPAGSPQGLAYDGTNLWLSTSGTDRKVYRINASGDVLTSDYSFNVPTTAGTVRGIVFNQGSLWLALSNPSKIYKINPQNGAVLDSINSPGLEPRGITFANGALYCNDTSIDSLFSYNFSTGKWTSVFATPTPSGGTSSNRFATGVTFDGANFWMANSTGDFDHVYKLSMTGVVLLQFQSPRIGLAQITGIVYTEE